MLAKVAGDSRFKVGEGDKTWNELEFVQPDSIQLGGGLATDQDGKIYVDFSQMPIEKFEKLVQSIRVPIWLSVNTNFYVDGATGSDVISSGRGFSADTAFKTIQACVNYVCDNYNLSRYNVYIFIAAGVYNESLILGKYTTNTGQIYISPWDKVTPSIDNEATYKTVIVSRVMCSDSVWNLFGIYIKFNDARTVAAGTYFRYQLVSAEKNAVVTLVGCKLEFDASNITCNGAMPSNYCIFANNAQISISCESSVNTEFVCSKPINIESPIVCLGASQSGTIMVLGTGRAKYTHEILVNGEFMIFAQTVNYGKILNGTGSGGKPPVFKVVEDAIGKRYQCDSGGAISTGNRGPSWFPGSEAGTVDSDTFSWYK